MAPVSHTARYKREPIAIVGSSCRFAGEVTTPAKLWDLLLNPVDLSRPPPVERFNIDTFYHPDAEYHGTTNNPKAYWLDQDHRAFDASFFQIPPKEAAAIDPQHRVLLEVVYESLESAGYSLQQYAGRNVAVYAGVMNADYDTLSQRDDLYASQYYATGNARSMAANRISYFFNFGGPSIAIDTACSSSHIALHQAMLNLRAGQSEMACITGVNMMLAPEQFVVESNLRMLSPTGYCHMWDAKADGYARGEGVAAILIKTLSRALADGDHIQAIIRESGTNSDGRTKGITMPNPEAQTRLIRETYARAGLDPKLSSARCQYFEAHGTGTQAGDWREAAAIMDVFFGRNSGSTSAEAKGSTLPRAKLGSGVRASANQDKGDQELRGDTIAPNPHLLNQTLSLAKNHSVGRDGRLLVGSIKTVIGHTEGAAGLAGIFKVIQGMQHGLVPPNLHFETLSEDVAPFYHHLRIPVRSEPWPEVTPGQPRRASVNSFGFGGANAHAIIESYLPSFHDELAKATCPGLVLPKQLTFREDEPEIRLPLLLSATSQRSLVALVTSYRDYIYSNPQVNIQQLAWHTFARRTALPFRTTISAASRTCLLAHLEALIAKAISNTTGHRAQQTSSAPRILGIFTGQGAQWPTMSKQLLMTSKTYRQTISELDRVLQHCASPPLWSLEGQIMADSAGSRVKEAAITQPLCTALQIALAELLRSIGVQLACVVGHSSGEIAAAYAADRLTAKDAILIAYYRGLYAHLATGKDGKKGGMLAVGLSKQDAAKLCASEQYRGRISIAASNSPKSITLSGDEDAVDEVEKHLSQNGTFARRLQVDTAYHSPHMATPAKMYASTLSRSNVSSLEVGQGSPIWISSVYGGGEPSDEELRGAYWRDNMVQPVLFQEAVQRAVQECGPFDCAIELGPHPALKGPVLETLELTTNAGIAYSSPLSRGKDDRQAVSEFLGFFWTRFGPEHLDMEAYIRQSTQPHLLNKDPVQAISMPTYSWDHSQTYWRESRISKKYHHRRHPPHELLGVRTRDDNDDELRWRNILKTNRVPWLQGHIFQGQVLLPASAYLVMAQDATKVVLNGRPTSVIELEELHFLAGLVVEPDTEGVEVLCSLKIITKSNEQPHQASDDVQAVFTVCSGPPDGCLPMKKNFTCGVRAVLENPNADILPRKKGNQAETLPASVERFYEMMAQTNLTYSGPFKAIETLDRRYNYATATLKRFHADDTTTLSISPATLDCCLQATFVTYSSPGDRALWTTFLPKTMARVRFNMALCDVKNGRAEVEQDVLTVEAHLNKETLISRNAPAKFTGDVCVFDAEDCMEVQIEGLTVSSFAATRREDDHELLLRSVWQVDCEDEIVQPQGAGAEDTEEGMKFVLKESCERIASFYLRHSQPDPQGQGGSHLPTGVPSNVWPQETVETLGSFIDKSPFKQALGLMQKLGDNVTSILPGILPVIVEEAEELHMFHIHVKRVCQQIAHRYPRMRVLDVTDAELGLARHVLAGLGSAFLELVAQKDTGTESFIKKLRLLDSDRQKIVFRDFGVTDSTFDTPVKMDLAIISAPTGDEVPAFAARLPDFRDSMRPGGFVLFVHDARDTLQQRLARSLISTVVQGAEQPTLGHWKVLFGDHGFTSTIRGAEQCFDSGLSLLVLQAHSPAKFALQRPLDAKTTDAPSLADCLLIIGGEAPQILQLSTDVMEQLRPRCTSIKQIPSIEEITSSDIDACTAIILLADLDQPVFTSLGEAALQALKIIMRPDMLIMWVTCNARGGNADHAASFGFSRSLRAETPGMVLQMLDLDLLDDAAGAIVAESFARLCLTTQNSAAEKLVVKEDGNLVLWTFETEEYIENGIRLVERVVPWKEGNDRANAYRRVVTEDVNSLQRCVELIRSSDIGVAGAFETEVTDSPKSIEAVDQAAGGQITILVDYSTVDKLSFCDTSAPSHLCLGRHIATGEAMVCMSDRNASYLSLAATNVVTVPPQICDMAQFAAWLARSLSALIVSSICNTVGKRLILVEPEFAFLDVVRHVCKGSDLTPLVFTTSMAQVSSGDDVIWQYMHSQSSDREIADLIPSERCEVLDLFAREHSHLYTRLKKLLPRNSRYHTTVATLRSVDAGTAGLLQPAIELAVQILASGNDKLQNTQHDSMVSLQRLLDNGTTSPFALVDWRADRAMSHIIKPIVGPQLFRGDRTYLFVGVTRDMGQSLCRLFIEHGARNIVLSSRNPDRTPRWRDELTVSPAGVRIVIEALDVTNLEAIKAFKHNVTGTWGLPPIAGVINGAMVLGDGVFSQMDLSTFGRVMRPKAIGSANLDQVFCEKELEFFIMTSSFAAIGGHAGQSNYAAANMYMIGLAANRRSRGLCATALNIGVIYGLGFLHREKEGLYGGLEREGYPPVSERGLHAMVLEAVACGRPEKGVDLTSGLSRFRWPEGEVEDGMVEGKLVLHWHRDQRFSHFTVRDEAVAAAGAVDLLKSGFSGVQDSASQVRELLAKTDNAGAIVDVLTPAFASRLEAQLHCLKGSISVESGISELGVDSLVAVEIRAWLWRAVGRDVGVLKILGAGSVGRHIAEDIVAAGDAAAAATNAEAEAQATAADRRTAAGTPETSDSRTTAVMPPAKSPEPDQGVLLATRDRETAKFAEVDMETGDDLRSGDSSGSESVSAPVSVASTPKSVKVETFT